VTKPLDELTVTDARERLADVIIDVAFRGRRVLLLRHGKPLAAVVSVDDLRRLQDLETSGAEP
jgi:prevent-host-death family protein